MRVRCFLVLVDGGDGNGNGNVDFVGAHFTWHAVSDISSNLSRT